uniref:Lin-28 homolog A n=1 Tax=Anas platyrhynchos platyrhynchos TaxID=8840 RepID=A0A493SWS3_ANAPP
GFGEIPRAPCGGVLRASPPAPPPPARLSICPEVCTEGWAPWCCGVGLGVCWGLGCLGLVLIPVLSCPQSKLHMEGFRSLKEGEAVEFTFKKSSKGLESIRVTGPGGVFCIGSERRPKGKSLQKRRSKGDRCYNCGGLDHHAKECKLPPQPKKCHFCQSISHMVANCPAKAQQSPSSQGKPAYFREEEDMHSSPLLPETRE